MIRLIVSDLDGTLLLNGSQSLPKGICDQILELKKRGILFAAASGRQYANLRRLFAPVQDEIAYICENGCLVCYRGKTLYKAEMEWETGQKILRAIMEKDTAEALLSGEDTSYIQPKDPEYRYRLEHIVKNNVTVVPDILKTPEPYFKISVYEKEGIRSTGSYWEERFSNQVTVVTSGNEWLDMMPLQVNKGTAFQVLLDHLGISKEQCMVFGDNYNDVEMLQMAGFGFAMDSAQPDIQKICGWHTDTVGHALEEFLSAGEAMFQKKDRMSRTGKINDRTGGK